MNEKSLRSAPIPLGDEALSAVAGGHGYGHGHCHRRGHGRGHGHGRPAWGSRTTQSNTVGDITINADGNTGSITLDLSQSNAA